MSNNQSSHLLPTYARVDLAFERGEGAWLIATNGERYLDFTSGVAVNALGHAHPHLVEAITTQANRVWHVSNLYRIPESERVAERLCAASFADVVFFCNSGAEAMECAIKMARKYQSASGRPERYRMITFEGAFHGRTLATLAAGGQKKYLDGFGPVVDGFDQVAFADLEATMQAQDVEVRRGDFCIVRTGQMEERLAKGEWGAYAGGPAPGLAFETCAWIFQKEIATICSDTWGIEVRPNETDELGQPLHWVTIPAIGVTHGEMFYVKDLAADCAADRVYEFFFTAPPLNITHGTGSPINPLAIK